MKSADTLTGILTSYFTPAGSIIIAAADAEAQIVYTNVSPNAKVFPEGYQEKIIGIPV